MTSPEQYKPDTKVWTKDIYTISTDSSLIPTETVNAWFASDLVYWATPMPEAATRLMLDSSISFGVYEAPTTPTKSNEDSQKSVSQYGKLIGLARLVTDFTTFAYLTDVFIEPSIQGQGLGKWLVRCVREVVEGMPYLRRTVLFTGDWKRSVPFYEKELGMTVDIYQRGEDGRSGTGVPLMSRIGRGHPSFKG